MRTRDDFDRLTAGMQHGPLRDHLRVVAQRLDAVVVAVCRTARQIAEIDRVTANLDADRITAEVKQARRDNAPNEIVDALQARFAAIQRLLNDRDERLARLELLTVQLDTVVARAGEITLTADPSSGPQITTVETDLAEVVVGLDALAAAMAELSALDAPARP